MRMTLQEKSVNHECDPKVSRLVKSAFDEAFAEIERPDYPSTCNQCGAEGTNAQIATHATHGCEQSAKFPCYIGEHDTCVGKSKKEGECPCPCGHTEAEAYSWLLYLLQGANRKQIRS